MPTGVLPPHRLRRRQAFGLAAGLHLGLVAPAGAQGDANRAAWIAFQARFVTPDGRVVDTGNGGVSHSEGQGWGLLLALRADDRSGFERILAWTRRTLRRPRDMLHAWRYRPSAAQPVDDPNNASDGDICIAWALLEAGQRWGVAEHAALGAAIGRDVLRLLVRQAGSYGVLLPGAQGFERADHVVVNLSYYIFPAFALLARAVPDPAWARLAADGLVLLRLARFGRWQLPPDWLQLPRQGGAMMPAPGWPPRFSYDAVRVPLWLLWGGLEREPALLHARHFWAAGPAVPAWVDLVTGALAPYPAPAGIVAVARLTAAGRAAAPPPPRDAVNTSDYYSSVLAMLAERAWHENSSTRS